MKHKTSLLINKESPIADKMQKAFSEVGFPDPECLIPKNVELGKLHFQVIPCQLKLDKL